MENNSSGIVLETRSCAQCGREFKVTTSSMQQYCSDYCRRKDGMDSKWKSWHKTQEQIERIENGIIAG